MLNFPFSGVWMRAKCPTANLKPRLKMLIFIFQGGGGVVTSNCKSEGKVLHDKISFPGGGGGGASSTSGSSIWSGGGRIFFWDFANIAKQNWVSEVSQYQPGSRAHLRVLEALEFLTIKYAFSYFSWYFFFKFLMYICVGTSQNMKDSGHFDKCNFWFLISENQGF